MQTIEIIYIGKRETSTGVIAHCFVTPAVIDNCRKEWEKREFQYVQDFTAEVERKSSLFKGKTTVQTVGGLYSTECEIDDAGRITSAKIGIAKFSGMVANPELVAAWRTMHDAVELARRKKTAEKNADADPQLTKAVQLLRTRYKTIPAGYKRGFQFWLLDQLEKR